ncbi:MAG: hypothetical protein J6A58_09105 [Oscillospiraceae bacterium]|nr:hypothetical protein [Oscillospiraceae bacterium]
MKNYVVENYENYREEDRLSTNNARRIEYLTTVRILDELIDSNQKILDCAAGTGIYAFHFAQQGNEVTAYIPRYYIFQLIAMQIQKATRLQYQVAFNIYYSFISIKGFLFNFF